MMFVDMPPTSISVQIDMQSKATAMTVLSTDRRSSGWKRAIGSLYAMLSLTDDWDGMDASAPDHDVVRSVIVLAEHVREHWPAPTASLVSPDGSVILEWQTPSKYLEIEFSDLSTAEWMMSPRVGANSHGNGLPNLTSLIGGESTY